MRYNAATFALSLDELRLCLTSKETAGFFPGWQREGFFYYKAYTP